MTPYATNDDVISIVGADNLAAVAPAPNADESAPPAEQIDADKLTRAVAAANSAADSCIQVRYTIPIAVADIPEWLTQAVARIAHYNLCDDDAGTTDIIKQRHADAMKTLEAVATGKRKLSINTTAEGAQSAERTGSGKAYITNTGGDRVFSRPNTRGIV